MRAPLATAESARMLITDTSRPDASVLARHLAGDAYGPGDAGYDEARTGFVAMLDLQPAIVALPESAQDVVQVVRYAREHGLRVAPQGTGHNAYPLADLSEAILLKTSRMRGVEIDPVRKVARVEAGAWWIDVSAPASEHGLAPLAGSSPDVGVVGYTLGGGASWLVRKHGLGANNVVAIEVVTGEGRLVRADHLSNPDLFWALRGGGGSFGVVTAIELRLFDLPELYAGVMFFPIERSAEVLKAWREWVRTVPDEATSIGRILNVPPLPDVPELLRGKSFVTVEMAYIGGQADGEALIAPLRDLGPSIDMFSMMPPVGLSKLHMDPEGQIPMAQSDHMLLSSELDDAAIDAIVAVIGTEQGSPLVMYELRHVGGAAARSGSGHGAIDRLDGEFMAFGVGIPMDEGLGALIDAHLGRIRDALTPYSTGREYLNFTERQKDASTFFGPTAYERLKAVRAQVDPQRTFLANHPIG
jgi:FAD/FMN-containing dehydrogenase